MGLFVHTVDQQPLPDDVPPASETGGSSAAADETGADPSGVQGQPADGAAEEQAITADDGSQPAEEPAPEDPSQTGQTAQTGPSEESSGTTLWDALAGIATELAETAETSSQPQTSTPTQTTTTSTSSSTPTIDAETYLAALSTQIDEASTPAQLQQAPTMLLVPKPKESSFQQAQEEGEAKSEEEKKALEQAKLQKQQQLQSSLRDAMRAGRTKAQQLALAAEAAKDPKAAALARQIGSRFTAVQKQLAEMETKRMQEVAKSFYKEYGSLMKGGGKLSPANQVVAKGAGKAEEGEDVTQKDLAEADEMAHTVDSEDTSYEDVKKPEPSWRKTPDKDSLAAKKKEADAELAHQKTTTQDPTKKPPTAADLLQTTALLAASTGPYKLTPEQAAERKALYSCPEGRAATTALQGGAVVHNTKGGFIRRVLGLVHRSKGEEDDTESTPESGALAITSALTALVGGSPVVPANERFIATPSRSVPTIDWLDPVSGKNATIRLSDLAYKRGSPFVPTLRREDYFGSTFDRDTYNRALAMGNEVSMSMLQRCPPSTGPVELHVG